MLDLLKKDIIKTNNSSHTIKEYIISFVKSNFNLSSIKEFIVRINELVITDDQIEKLTHFKNVLQSIISGVSTSRGNSRLQQVPDQLLLYFVVKDFITDKRLELLYEIKDEGLLNCMDKYTRWRIKDVILNTKWKYENEVFCPSNPIIDQLNEKEYKNIKETPKASGVSAEEIKKNFGYHKRWIYISSYTQFCNSLPVEILNKYGSFSRVFKNIKEASKQTNISEKNIRYFIIKGGYFKTNGIQQAYRYISFYEYFIRSLPVIINEKKYLNLRNSSQYFDMCMSELKSYIDSDETFRVDSTDYTARFAYDISAYEDKRASSEKDKKLADEIYTKIKELKDIYSLEYLFKITSPAA